jgi:hypothetical protein
MGECVSVEIGSVCTPLDACERTTPRFARRRGFEIPSSPGEGAGQGVAADGGRGEPELRRSHAVATGFTCPDLFDRTALNSSGPAGGLLVVSRPTYEDGRWGAARTASNAPGSDPHGSNPQGPAVVQVSASMLARIRQAEVALERQDRARRCRPAPVDASPRKVAKGPAPVAKRRELYQPDRPESTWDTSAQ